MPRGGSSRERWRAAPAIGLQWNLIRQRVADELTARTRMRGVKLGLRRQQAQHEVAGGADGAHPPLPPGPHLRTHVLHGGSTGLCSVGVPGAG